MPHADSNGVKLYYEETGSGTPVIFAHEFAGDHRSWEPQVRFFSRRYRCITYNARGYPPSDVPRDGGAYSQAHAVDDIAAVLRHLGIAQAHVCGLSMGGYATLHFGIRYPQMALSLTICGAGHGSDPATRQQFLQDSAALADRLEHNGIEEAIQSYAVSAYRIPYQRKDPRGFDEFRRQFAEHSSIGSALTTRGYQLKRPTIYELETDLSRITVPALVVVGDEDGPCLEPALFLKVKMRSAGLLVIPNSGHSINLEEAETFNRALLDFWTAAEAGTWPVRG